MLLTVGNESLGLVSFVKCWSIVAVGLRRLPPFVPLRLAISLGVLGVVFGALVGLFLIIEVFVVSVRYFSRSREIIVFL